MCIRDRNKIKASKKVAIAGDKQVPGDPTGLIFYRYDGTNPGPGPNEEVEYRENKPGSRYNVPNNPDIF